MSIIDEIRYQDHMHTRLRRAGLLVLYAVLTVGILYLFARRWSAFAALIPPVAVAVVVLFALRIVHVMRFRHGERRHRDRRHTDRRDPVEAGAHAGLGEPAREARSAAAPRRD